MSSCGGTPGKPGLDDPSPYANLKFNTGKPCPGCPDCRPCERCGGRGKIPDRGWGWVWPCPRCQGTGVEPGYGKHLLAQSGDDKSAITLTLTREEVEKMRDAAIRGYAPNGIVAKIAAALEGSEDG